eukprot:m.317623 g.317623  ORF g.317623 m.317623 type:complete len:566 (-) comp27558_c1_seq4:2926-4623(-)
MPPPKSSNQITPKSAAASGNLDPQDGPDGQELSPGLSTTNEDIAIGMGTVPHIHTAGAPSSQPRPGERTIKMPQAKTAPVQIFIDESQDGPASNLSHGDQVPQVAREPRYTAFNNSDLTTPLGSDEALEASDESTRLRAEVTLLRDMLVTANIHASSVAVRERASLSAKGTVSKPGRGGNRTLMERLDELNGEVKEAKSKRLRTEILGCFILLMYLVIGVAFYTQNEGWTWQFALYFCVTIATTVGYGDQNPIDTNGGMLFTCCFVFFGVTLVLGLGSYLVLQMIADRRNRVLAKQRSARRKIRENEKSSTASTMRGSLEHSDGILQSALTKAESTVSFLKSLLLPFVLMLMAWSVWIVFFMFYTDEELTFVEALYFAMMSGTTLGFGDIAPQTKGGQHFATVWLLVLVILTTTFLGRVAEHLIPKPDDFRLNNVMLEGPQAVLELCDTDGDGSVEYYEWLECLCLATGKVDSAFIRTAREHFDCLEITGDGKITRHDVDVQQALYKRWRTQQRVDTGAANGLIMQTVMVQAMGTAWLHITRKNRSLAEVAPTEPKRCNTRLLRA